MILSELDCPILFGCYNLAASAISVSQKLVFLVIGNYTDNQDFYYCCTNYSLYTFSYADGQKLTLKSILPFARSVVKPADWTHDIVQSLAYDDRAFLLYTDLFPPGDGFDSSLFVVDSTFTGSVTRLTGLSSFEPTAQSSALLSFQSSSNYFFFDKLSRLFQVRMDGSFTESGMSLGSSKFPFGEPILTADQVTGKLYLASNTLDVDTVTPFIVEITPDPHNFILSQVHNTTIAYSAGMKFWANDGILFTVPQGSTKISGFDVQTGVLVYSDTSDVFSQDASILFDNSMP